MLNMTTEVHKVMESRQQEREGKSDEARQTLALEQIADTLEALRIDLQSVSSVLVKIASRVGRSS